MSKEQAYEIIQNLFNQITAKKADFDVLQKALDILYNPRESECRPELSPE